MNLIFLNRQISIEDDLKSSIIVPLNSAAMRDVLEKGLNYLKVEDFIDYAFWSKYKEDIGRHYQDLFDQADIAVSEIYRIPQIKKYGPFNVFYHGMRQTIDTLVGNYLIFDRIVSKVRPSKLTLLTIDDNSSNPPISEMAFLGKVYKPVLDQIASKYNLDFNFKSLQINKDKQHAKSCVNVLRQILRRFVKNSNLYHFLQIGICENKIQKIKAKALFLQDNWGVYYYSQYFTDVDYYSSDSCAALPVSSMPVCSQTSFEAFWGMFHHGLAALNGLFGFDVTFIIKDVFRMHFKLVPGIVSAALGAEKYLKTANPQYVFYTNLSDDMLPFKMALNWNNNITKVVKSHGHSLFSAVVWRNTELRYTDIYFLEDNEICSYMNQSAHTANYSVKCEVDAINYSSYRAKYQPKNKLVYVPWLFSPLMFADMIMIPQALFFRIQLQILDALNSQKDLDVVYKCLPPGRFDYHYPMPEFIKQHFSHIKVSHKRLKSELSDAKYCLLDAPSSSMRDAINMRVPCHSLVWNRFHLRPSALDAYRRFITFFESDIDVSDKVQTVLSEKKFHIITPDEVGLIKRKPEDITAIFDTI